MPFDDLVLHFFSFLLVVQQLIVPILVKITYFFNMSHLDLPFLLFESRQQLVLALLFKFIFDLGESSLGGLGLHVLPSFLTCFLMGIQDLSA